MIPFANQDGLRDYRVPARPHPLAPRRRWPWLLLLVALIVLLDVALAQLAHWSGR